jgi:hypothetical protein
MRSFSRGRGHNCAAVRVIGASGLSAAAYREDPAAVIRVYGLNLDEISAYAVS